MEKILADVFFNDEETRSIELCTDEVVYHRLRIHRRSVQRNSFKGRESLRSKKSLLNNSKSKFWNCVTFMMQDAFKRLMPGFHSG